MKYFAATLLTLIALQTAAVVWIAVSWELARRQSIALMEETNNQFRSSVIVREVPVTDVEPRPLASSGEEIVTGKVSKIVTVPATDVPPVPPPSPTDYIDLRGDGPGYEVWNFVPGLYTATISGDTFALDVTMETVDGRSRFSWGHTESIYFGMGDHDGAELFAGPMRITVNPPGDYVRWRIVIERRECKIDPAGREPTICLDRSRDIREPRDMREPQRARELTP